MKVYYRYANENVNHGFNTNHFSYNKKYKEEVLKLANNIFYKTLLTYSTITKFALPTS
ncbi:MAG: hypothetical protein M9888_06185 [Chitinophagales bacterium]|nr:hypothetical protein [Chitinophagales bacterium]